MFPADEPPEAKEEEIYHHISMISSCPNVCENIWQQHLKTKKQIFNVYFGSRIESRIISIIITLTLEI